MGLSKLCGSLLQQYFFRGQEQLLPSVQYLQRGALWGCCCTLGELQIEKFLLANDSPCQRCSCPCRGRHVPEVPRAPAQRVVLSIPGESGWEGIRSDTGIAILLYFYVKIKMVLELTPYPCCRLRSPSKCIVCRKHLVLSQE